MTWRVGVGGGLNDVKTELKRGEQLWLLISSQRQQGDNVSAQTEIIHITFKIKWQNTPQMYGQYVERRR